MAMSPWAIAGIVVGGVAVVGILYAVSNRESDSLPPPRGGSARHSESDGWGAADVGRVLYNLLPGLFSGINSLGSGARKDESSTRQVSGQGTDIDSASKASDPTGYLERTATVAR